MKYCFFRQSLKSRATQCIIRCVLFLIINGLFGAASAGAVQGPAAKDLDAITVRSATFPSGKVTLKNGEYRGPAAPGSVTETVVRLTDLRAFGSMNGKDTAAIVLATDAGGSGLFYDLALLTKGKKGWVNVDTVFLGDRVKVHSVSVKDAEITVSMTAHGSGDAMCCPTREVTRRFTVQADHLIAEPDVLPVEQDLGIVGPIWQWVRTRYSDDTVLTRPANTAGYTLQLDSKGKVLIRADCNEGGGSFTMNGSKLSITITHKTLAACPEGSLENPFIFDLNRTVGFLIKNGTLFLDLKLDTGTMEFRGK